MIHFTDTIHVQWNLSIIQTPLVTADSPGVWVIKITQTNSNKQPSCSFNNSNRVTERETLLCTKKQQVAGDEATTKLPETCHLANYNDIHSRK